MKRINIKRVYEPFSEDDGIRLLVDRLWPRGINKEKAHIDEWIKEIAPSNELRKWYSHDPDKWEEFKSKYYKELEPNKDLCSRIANRKEVITLLFSSKELKLNNAAALKEYLESF